MYESPPARESSPPLRVDTTRLARRDRSPTHAATRTRSRRFAWLMLVLVIPMSGSTCVVKSGSRSNGDGNKGGTRIAVCNPPSATCSTGVNSTHDPIAATPGNGPISHSSDSKNDASRAGEVEKMLASTSGLVPRISAMSLLPPVHRGGTTIPEPGSALLFAFGALMISRHLSSRRGP
jgi:hypothetical protein